LRHGSVPPANGITDAVKGDIVADVRAFVAGLVIVVATGACSGCGGKKTDAGSLVGSRPYGFKVPTGYVSGTPTPLVILLHGYASTGAGQESYFQLGPIADEQTFLYATPDGTVDPAGHQFWNADDACCDFFGSGVDDVAYVDAIIDDVSSKYTVDAKRVYVVGHSNGAFMAHRLACDLSERVAAIAALAGAVWSDGGKCRPNSPVSVLDVHGDSDTVISYDSSAIPANLVAPGVPSKTQPPYPSEVITMATWAANNLCAGKLAATGLSLDLDALLPGDDTLESVYGGCPTGVDVALWTIAGGSHVPALVQPTWGEAVWGFLKGHGKP
jgi:polyhydroxybutyrate depolymerase